MHTIFHEATSNRLTDTDSVSTCPVRLKRTSQENIAIDTQRISSMLHQQAILSLASSLCFVLPTTHAFLAHNIFETGDQRIFPLFSVDSPEQLATLATNTSTQQKIIKDAVKTSVGRFLSERHQLPLPPEPQELSLSQLGVGD